MEFWVTIAGLVRRRRVIVPALLVAVALGAAAYVTTPVTYVSSTTMILTSTEYGGSQSQNPAMPSDLINPMLYFNDSLKTTSAILIEAMNTEEVATELGATGRTMFHVDDGRTNPNLLGLNGPFLYIVGDSTSPAEAERVVHEAQTLMRDKLRDWQSALKAPERTFVSLAEVVPPSTPAPSRGRATKLGLMAFIFGLGLSLGIAYLRHQTRDRRRARAVAQPAASGPPPSAFRPGRRLGWRPSFRRRAANEGDAEPVLVPPSPKKTEPALVPMIQQKTEPAPKPTSEEEQIEPVSVPTSQKKKAAPAPVPTSEKEQIEPVSVPTSEAKNGTAPVPTSQGKNGTAPVPTSQAKNGTAPVPTSQAKNGTAPVPTPRKKTELALIRRSMKKKAELAAVPPSRPARPAVRRAPTSPHNPGPAVVQDSERVLVPVPVTRNDRSKNP